MKHVLLLLSAFFVASLGAIPLLAETGAEAWLRYARLDDRTARKYESLPSTLVNLGDSALLRSAQEELVRGIRGMLGKNLRVDSSVPRESAIILGTLPALLKAVPGLRPPQELRDEGFWLTHFQVQGFDRLVVAGASERAVLYGVFSLLSKMARSEALGQLNEVQQPHAPVRWVDQWDNLDGSIERGYAGRSIFFENGNVRADLTRVHEYSRLLASVGINGCNLNNVNANPRLLQDNFLPQLARIAEVFRPWGIRLSIAVDLGSPKTIGGLDTFDPVDAHVTEWWRKKADQVYAAIPDFGGFVVKADSEGRVGPSAYGRTQADAANVIARALNPHGGVVFYRAFVYDHHLDWGDPKNDRARAAYDIFHPLDGRFDDNVIIQIKHGPIDFQVREPASALFGGLEKTNEAIELQITQEYMGQQRHLCFLVPMWKEALDFDMQADGRATPVKSIVSGHAFRRALGGFAGVANVGLDVNWLGNPMAMANLYGFARLAWSPSLSSANIANEWTRLTFGNDPVVVRIIDAMLLSSWPTYENYTGPLGAGTLTDILGSHYGPGVESSEGNGWGQWHRADHDGIGMDRSVRTGTGYVGQYSPGVQKNYETPADTPESLLLFFHHVPYTYRLNSSKTVIQHIYDSHYDGVAGVHEFVRMWQSLRGLLGDDERYEFVLERLEYQAGHAIVWRDAICNWFFRTSGIPDAQGRVGHYPGRVEAENMQLTRYVPIDVTPWENASGGKAIECESPEGCAAAFPFEGASGTYEIDVQYFDQNDGEAKFHLYVRNRLVDEWVANDQLPTTKIGGDSSTRHRTSGVVLRPLDEIRIEGIPDKGEVAAIDYVEIVAPH